MPKNKRLHFKDVNTLRFFAFIPVFLYCILFLSNTKDEGVHNELTQLFQLLSRNSLDFFFFLSAFLLASQSLREYKYTDKFSLKNFYVRRILRILPLFVFGLLFAFLIHPWILNALKLNEIVAPSASSYLMLIPNYGAEYTKEQFIYLAVIWTIYMFIQFYFIWGLILRFLKDQLFYVSLFLMVIGIVARIMHISGDGSSYYVYIFDTLSYGVPIGIGGLLSLLIRNEHPLIEKLKSFTKSRVIMIYSIGTLFTISAYLFSFKGFGLTIIPLFTCLFYSYILIDQTFGKNSFVKLRTYKIFTHLGKLSYGLIFYQSIVSVLCIIGIDSLDFDLSSTSVKIAFLLASLTVSWIIADISYKIIEKPLLRLRREFKSI